MNILRKIFFVKSQTHCKRYSEKNIFCEENLLCQDNEYYEESIFCEEPDSLQTKFRMENILCKEATGDI